MPIGRSLSWTTPAVVPVPVLVLLAALLPVGRQPLAQCPADTIVICDVTTTSSAPSYSVSGCAFNNAAADYDLVTGQVSAGVSVAASYVAVTTNDIYTITGPIGPVAFSAQLDARAGTEFYGVGTAGIRSDNESREVAFGPCVCFGTGYTQTLSLPLTHAVGEPFRLSLILSGLIPSSNRVRSKAVVTGNLGFTLPPGYIVTSCQGYSSAPTALRPTTWGQLKLTYR